MNRHLTVLIFFLLFHLTVHSLPVKKQSLGFLTDYLDSLTIEGKVPGIDNLNKKLLVTVPGSYLNKFNIPLTVRFIPKKDTYSLYIDGKLVTSGSGVKLSILGGGQEVVFQIREGFNAILTSSLDFTSLPLVQLYSDSILNSTYALGRIVVTEAVKTGPAEQLLANLKTRGAYAGKFEKNAFSIKLKDTDGSESLDRSFFGLRNDNDWILDAMSIDKARMRNRVSTDLWNDFSIKPSFTKRDMVNGTRGQFVEVFLNDVYFGLYCMTEKVDRKQLKLKEFVPATSTSPVVQRGALYKVDGWSFESLMGNTNSSYYKAGQTIGNYKNTSASWRGYAVKYPDLDDGEPIDWKIMYNAVVLCSDFTPDSIFEVNAFNLFDLPQILDYYLFLEFILAADNQGKNMYFAAYDQSVSPMLFIVPWDLDATWGRRWNGTSSATGPLQDFDAFVDKSVQAQSNLFKRLKKLNVKGFRDQLPVRYRELRGNYFAFDNIMNRFQTYHDLFANSGAMKREIKRWSGYSFAPVANFDIGFLKAWISSRINYLDKQYLGGPYTDLSEVIETQLSLWPNPASDICNLQGLKQGETVELFTLQGQLVGRNRSDGESIQIDLTSFLSGVYLVKAGARTIKLIKH